MSQFAAFALSFGGFLALTAAIAAWLVRSTTSPLWLKIVMPSLMMVLACYAPYSVPNMMGYPVSVSMQGLPDQAELVAFVPHDEVGRVDLWLRTSDVPRAYDTALTAQMKKTLREAQEQMAHGRRTVLAKKAEGKENGARRGDAPAVGQDDASYVLDENALTKLPEKE
jgi:hypothetical protein